MAMKKRRKKDFFSNFFDFIALLDVSVEASLSGYKAVEPNGAFNIQLHCHDHPSARQIAPK